MPFHALPAFQRSVSLIHCAIVWSAVARHRFGCLRLSLERSIRTSKAVSSHRTPGRHAGCSCLWAGSLLNLLRSSIPWEALMRTFLLLLCLAGVGCARTSAGKEESHGPELTD